MKWAKHRVLHSHLAVALWNVALVYLVLMLSRVAFFCENWMTFAPRMSWPLAQNMLRGAWMFDTSALIYVNALYLVLLFLPLHWKEKPSFYRILKWLFVITNGLALASNLVDAVYFQFSGRRSTVTVFSQFANENNLGGIFFTEFINHWYLVLAFATLVFILWKGYATPRAEVYGARRRNYYVVQVLSLVLLTPLAIVGIRGSATAGTRPITISHANQYVNRPVESAVVLNTPFSLIRSIGKKAYVTPDYMTTAEMERIFQPVITPGPADSLTLGKRNVVILIIESMGKEYIGSFNRDLEGGNYRGYMPFIDSLLTRSLTFEYSYANGRVSMDAMPSLLSGLPMFVEPFFVTPASFNEVRGVPSMLATMGYRSAFFHGGHNISMGFSAFAHSIGYEHYYGLDEYCQSPKYGGMDDFDGKWAIWDEPFFQFTLDEIEKMPQPFVATVFSASSHHPFGVPDRYSDSLRDEGGLPIHKCIRYTDLALRRFFERAAKQPWYNNTIFVLVADHTNQTKQPGYQTDLGLYRVPIIFFTPDGSIKPRLNRESIAQQTDVMPSLMHLVGYDKPYVAFGTDLFGTPPEQTWAVNYNNGIYQYVAGDYLIQFDGTKLIGAYRFKTDLMLEHNVLNPNDPVQRQMTVTLKAIIQQYMSRMNENRLIVK